MAAWAAALPKLVRNCRLAPTAPTKTAKGGGVLADIHRKALWCRSRRSIGGKTNLKFFEMSAFKSLRKK